MVEPNSNTGERLARLEVQSMNLERAVDRVEKKVDHLEGKIDGLETTINQAVGGMRGAAIVWGVVVTLASVVAPYIIHALGWGK